MYWAQRPPTNYREYDSYGPLFAMNEHVAIFAQNDKVRFVLVKKPYNSSSMWNCTLDYTKIKHSSTSMTYFVYSVAIGAKQNSSHLAFAYIEENGQNHVFLTVIFLEDTATGCLNLNRNLSFNVTECAMGENGIVAMDPYGLRAYAISTFCSAFINLTTSEASIIDNSKVVDMESIEAQVFFPKAITITEDHHAFIACHRAVFINYGFIAYLYVVNFLDFNNAKLITLVELTPYNFGQDGRIINRNTTMSIALDEQYGVVLVGIPQLDMVIFSTYNDTKHLEIFAKQVSDQSGVGFGKSIALINGDTYVVLAYAQPTLPWSKSQIQVRIIIIISRKRK
ncbi:unnamed protein product [Rotaria sp. Silwood2]|nr:unnamed protein product [Rotaria sp. Silwood2]